MTALTAANQLTLLRMLLIPVFALLVLYDRMGWALIVFIVAAAHRRASTACSRAGRASTTTLGAWLDPVADKLLLPRCSCVLTLPLPQLVHRIPLWLTVLVISRDIGIVLTVAIVNLAVGPRTFRPSIFGKAATATFIADRRGDAAVRTGWSCRRRSARLLRLRVAGASRSSRALHYAADDHRLCRPSDRLRRAGPQQPLRGRP